ncbi:DUF445 domain-containing protein [Lunatibacter salilacus]|uniref:DUF445 domain-containing protein n=1 Tax=Lunatibacter salilacus TaxID=2483804 RepID=UPI00131ADE74|nr:DUF445 domain-containing protein [Lunatibacter salilacus]
MKSKIGHYSLLTAVCGFFLLEVSLFQGWLQGDFWRILLTGFEAATIGALADWFAVSALFYEIPIPIIRRHTNIIVKNREKLTEGIVDMVTTKWLSPEIIQEKLADVNLADNMIRLMEEPANLNRTLDILRLVAGRFADNLDHPKLAIWMQKLLKDQMNDVELGKPLGNWLVEAVTAGKHQPVVDIMIHEISKTIQQPTTRSVVFDKLKATLEAYEKQDWIKKSTIWIGKRTGGIDLELLTDRILDIVQLLGEEIEGDRQHPIRLKLDGYFMEFAESLASGEDDSTNYIEDLKTNLLLNAGTRRIIQQVLKSLKVSVHESLENNETVFMRLVKGNVIDLITYLKNDKETQESIDSWIKNTLTQLVDKYHPEIGNMVRTSLGKLDDKGMMEQIKDKVGDDLQYIRLNGAVVGGLVGLVIALIRWMWLE